jgi:hypothetical protein
VTAADFERIALEVPGVARAHCVPRRNLEGGEAREVRTGREVAADVSVVIVPDLNLVTSEPIAPIADTRPEDLCDQVRKYLEPKRLLATRVHVVAARRAVIALALTVRTRAGVAWRRASVVAASPPDATLTLTVHSRDETPGEPLLNAAEQALRNLLEPDQGWPFSRPIYLSEIYDCLARLPGADYVTSTEGSSELAVHSNETWRLEGEPEAIALAPDELPEVPIHTAGIDMSVL